MSGEFNLLIEQCVFQKHTIIILDGAVAVTIVTNGCRVFLFACNLFCIMYQEVFKSSLFGSIEPNRQNDSQLSIVSIQSVHQKDVTILLSTQPQALCDNKHACICKLCLCFIEWGKSAVSTEICVQISLILFSLIIDL